MKRGPSLSKDTESEEARKARSSLLNIILPSARGAWKYISLRDFDIKIFFNFINNYCLQAIVEMEFQYNEHYLIHCSLKFGRQEGKEQCNDYLNAIQESHVWCWVC